MGVIIIKRERSIVVYECLNRAVYEALVCGLGFFFLFIIIGGGSGVSLVMG